MTQRTIALLVPLFVASATVSSAGDQVASGDDVATAIQRGATWLESAAASGRLLQTGGRVVGRQSLAAWALSRSGVPAKRTEPYRAWVTPRLRWLTNARAWNGDAGTYNASLAILALAAPSLERAPTPAGSAVFWRKEKTPRAARWWVKAGVGWLLATAKAGRSWGYTPMAPKENFPPQIEHWDLSNTQFAVYALFEAELAGVKVPVRTWRKVLGYVLSMQQRKGPAVSAATCRGVSDSPLTRPPGSKPRTSERTTRQRVLSRLHSAGNAQARGWSYGGNLPRARFRQPDLAMTGAGLSSAALIVARLEQRKQLGGQRDRALRALRDGVAWLARAWPTVPALATGGHREGHDPFYTLWSLSKAVDACGLEVIAGEPAWQTLAQVVLKLQRPDGAWGDPDPAKPGSDIDTAFALLILNRGTLYAFSPKGKRPQTQTLRRKESKSTGKTAPLGPTRVRPKPQTP